MGDAEISILSWMYDVCIVVYHPHPETEFDRWSIITPSGGDVNTVECTDPQQMIYLINKGQLHYDLLTDLRLKEDGEIWPEDEALHPSYSGTDDDDDAPVTPPLSEDDMSGILTDDEDQNLLSNYGGHGQNVTLTLYGGAPHRFQPYNKGRRVSAI